MPKARRTSYNLAFKLKIVAEAEAVENNSDMASVSPWSVAKGKITRTFLTARLNCQRDGNDGMFHAVISGARSKNTGMVYRAEKQR